MIFGGYTKTWIARFAFDIDKKFDFNHELLFKLSSTGMQKIHEFYKPGHCVSDIETLFLLDCI